MAIQTFDAGDQTLKEWFDCATSFCDLTETLDREGVNQVSWNEHKVPNGLHLDGVTFLRASGVAVERFARIAETFVLNNDSALIQSLTFSVEAGNPIVDGRLAIMRIQSLPMSERKPSRAQFVPVGLEQHYCEPMLFGAEARIELLTDILHCGKGQPYRIKPRLQFSYEVTGQSVLKVFASILEGSVCQPLWRMIEAFNVKTSILLTKDGSQDSIDDEWELSNDPDGQRLLRFCHKASRLAAKETVDWPPYFRLSYTLEAANTEEDLQRVFAAICAHANLIIGPSGGWREMLGLVHPAQGCHVNTQSRNLR